MADNRTRTRRQDGFTLIEIIAVLVILGILAIVAIPKYMSLQDNARKQAAYNLVAAAQSALSMAYANYKFNNSNPTAASTICTGNVSISSVTSEDSKTTNITCDGNIANGIVKINANVSKQEANGNWTSPEYTASS